MDQAFPVGVVDLATAKFDGPLGAALAELGASGKTVGLFVRGDLATGNATAVFAWHVAGGLEFGVEFAYDHATKRPAGYIGLEWTF